MTKQNYSQKRIKTTATNNEKSKEPYFRLFQQVLVKVDKIPVGYYKSYTQSENDHTTLSKSLEIRHTD